MIAIRYTFLLQLTKHTGVKKKDQEIKSTLSGLRRNLKKNGPEFERMGTQICHAIEAVQKLRSAVADIKKMPGPVLHMSLWYALAMTH